MQQRQNSVVHIAGEICQVTQTGIMHRKTAFNKKGEDLNACKCISSEKAEPQMKWM